MDFSSRMREGAGLPSIQIDHNPQGRFSSNDSPRYGPDSTASAMSIPGSQRHTEPLAPPPLPPPRYILRDEYHQHAEFAPAYHGDYQRESSFSPREPGSFSSFGNSLGNSLGDEQSSYRRRPDYPGVKVERDEGYASLSSTSNRSQDSLPTGFGLHHNRYRFQSGADAEVSALKNMLNPMLSPSSYDPPSRRSSADSRLPPLAVPLPIRGPPSILDSPDRFTQTPLQSALSPRSAPFLRSPNELTDSEYSPRHRTKRAYSGSIPDDATISTQGSHDMTGAEDLDVDETSSIRKLSIEDYGRSEYHPASLKRRASSPPGEDPIPPFGHSQSDLLRRRDGTSRSSPVPRLSTIPQGSVSSSISTPRTGSYASTFSLNQAGSISSMSSYGRRSPVGLSPNAMSPIVSEPSCLPHYASTSPRAAMSRAPHQRTISEHRPASSQRNLTDLSKPNGQKRQVFYMCECCPKKPKKFETHDELAAHEAEKQYECAYCGNRFKNKNEAERHQNSLHVRKHSWSCKALSGYDRAFHESTSRPGEADMCGYCGDEFKRSGPLVGGGPSRQATEQDWEARIRHLTDIHKFRECNSSKKFYRADHFRQHLKHSHAGTSGKWTNMLENACMLDEDLAGH